MDAKVVRLPLKRKPALSRLMIVALVEAGAKQIHGVPFGPEDIKGSFSFLIERGLVILEQVSLQNEQEYLWQLTPEAMEILAKLGIAKKTPDVQQSSSENYGII